MSSLSFSVACDARQIGDALTLRRRVYGEEGLVGAGHPDFRYGDTPDYSPRTAHLLIYDEREPIGTLRLTAAGHARAGAGARTLASGRFGFEIEERFTLHGFLAPGVVPAEVTRFCVRKQYRCSRATALLYRGLVAECARRGITHLVAAANMETDSLEDATLAHRAVETRLLVDSRFSAIAKTSVLPPPTGRRALYSESEREQARAGSLARMALPRTLALFALKMHARCIGAPCYEPEFNVFALPVVAEVARMVARSSFDSERTTGRHDVRRADTRG